MKGRPTDYTDELLDKADLYLDEYTSEIPSVAGLSLFLGIARATVYRWAGEEGKGRFKDILERILSTQEQELFDKGLNQTWNASIVKLALGKHGYHDKQDTTVAAPDGGPVGVAAFEFKPVDNRD